MHGFVPRAVQTSRAAAGRPAGRPDLAGYDTIIAVSSGGNG